MLRSQHLPRNPWQHLQPRRKTSAKAVAPAMATAMVDATKAVANVANLAVTSAMKVVVSHALTAHAPKVVLSVVKTAATAVDADVVVKAATVRNANGLMPMASQAMVRHWQL